jgi:hypothetical protein
MYYCFQRQKHYSTLHLLRFINDWLRRSHVGGVGLSINHLPAFGVALFNARSCVVAMEHGDLPNVCPHTVCACVSLSRLITLNKMDMLCPF